MTMARDGFIRRSNFARRARWVLAGGLLLGAIASPTVTAEKSSVEIDESSFVSIGGIDQWLSVKGDDRNNPALLVVHDGPGEPQWPTADKYKPWEKPFTVVQWDQRGAGHNFDRHGTQTPDVTLDRIAKDGIEVATYLCRTLGKKKIIILGHSWGSIVAIKIVQMRPELFAAYVGRDRWRVGKPQSTRSSIGCWQGAPRWRSCDCQTTGSNGD
jgi:pimeloyl-ACP methyl ester carboxylesterase